MKGTLYLFMVSIVILFALWRGY